MNKLSHSPIEGQTTRLRLLEEADIEMTRRWRNQDHIRIWFNYSNIIEPDEQKNWFNEYKSRVNDYQYIIEDKQNNNQPIGQVGIYNIDLGAGIAEYGRLLIGDSSYLSRGLAKDASKTLIKFWEQNYGIHFLHLLVKGNNSRAIALYKKLGFIESDNKKDCLVMTLNLHCR